MSDIKIKETFSKMMEEDVPEMTQEEAIMNYRENDTIDDTRKKVSTDEDNTEESEHLKRVKKELLESLERVKKLEKKIYGESSSKNKINVKENKAKQVSRSKEAKEEIKPKKENDRERE